MDQRKAKFTMKEGSRIMILPQFAAQLETTKSFSGKLFPLYLILPSSSFLTKSFLFLYIVKKGRTAYLLKEGSKRKKTKKEMAERKEEKKKEQVTLHRYKKIDDMVTRKGMTIESVVGQSLSTNKANVALERIQKPESFPQGKYDPRINLRKPEEIVNLNEDGTPMQK